MLGYMGSGKSKAGKALAKSLGFSFVDTDHLIETKTGSGIPVLFGEHGEPYFRHQEMLVLEETFRLEKTVVSTGGGLPCFEGNMEKMLEHGMTIFLEASSGLLYQRLSHNRSGRPLIANLDEGELRLQINSHLKIREPYYRQSDLIVSAADIDVADLVQRVKSHPKFKLLNSEKH